MISKEKLTEIVQKSVEDAWYNRRSLNPITEQTETIVNAIWEQLNKPDVSVVQEPIVVGTVCPHFHECLNGGKNQYCDLQTLKELDCFVGQTER